MGTQRRRRALRAAAARPLAGDAWFKRLTAVALKRLAMRALFIGAMAAIAAYNHVFPVSALAVMYAIFLAASFASDLGVAVVQRKLEERRAKKAVARSAAAEVSRTGRSRDETPRPVVPARGTKTRP